MKCPVDGTALLITERSGVEIDYCPQCRGVWLDRGELDKIIDRAADLAGGGRQTSTAPYPREGDHRLTATGIITVAPGVGGRKGSSVTSSTSTPKTSS